MTLVEKIQKISEKECDKFKRLPFSLWVGHCSEVFDKVGVPRTNPIPEEYFDAVIDGIIDSFFGGCEPEFENEEDYERYEKAVEILKSCEFTVEKRNEHGFFTTKHSPYRDKTIPFLNPTITE